MIGDCEFSVILFPLVDAMRLVGVFTSVLLVIIFAPRVFNGFCVPLNDSTVRAYKFLSRKKVLFFLCFCFCQLLAWPLGMPPLDLTVLAVSLGAGLLVALWFGSQGLNIPLGHGLALTIDKAPNVGVKLSEYVVSFHIGADIVKNRRRTVKKILRNLKKIKCLEHKYDVVFKSWIFGTRGSKNNSAKCFRFFLLSAWYYIWLFLIGIISASGMWAYVVHTDSNYQLVDKGLCIAVAATIIALIGLVGSYSISSWLAPGVFGNVAPGFRNDIAHRALKNIEEGTQGFTTHFISLRPLSLQYLIAMSITNRRVFKSSDGNEAGFVLVHQ
jgi:hypothetical protein